MATKKDLEIEIKRLNEKYCKSGKNELRLSQAYGGYQVQLTGKRTKKGGFYRNSLMSGCVSITSGYGDATETLSALYKADSRGWLSSDIKWYRNG